MIARLIAVPILGLSAMGIYSLSRDGTIRLVHLIVSSRACVVMRCDAICSPSSFCGMMFMAAPCGRWSCALAHRCVLMQPPMSFASVDRADASGAFAYAPVCLKKFLHACGGVSADAAAMPVRSPRVAPR